jgi:hypothetical protein
MGERTFRLVAVDVEAVMLVVVVLEHRRMLEIVVPCHPEWC